MSRKTFQCLTSPGDTSAKLHSERKDTVQKKGHVIQKKCQGFRATVEKVNSGALRNSEVWTFQDSHLMEQLSTVLCDHIGTYDLLLSYSSIQSAQI